MLQTIINRCNINETQKNDKKKSQTMHNKELKFLKKNSLQFVREYFFYLLINIKYKKVELLLNIIMHRIHFFVYLVWFVGVILRKFIIISGFFVFKKRKKSWYRIAKKNIQKFWLADKVVFKILRGRKSIKEKKFYRY